MTQGKPLIFGIIHIGSSSLSMRIVAYRGVNDAEVIEEVKKETSFGEEVFLNKKLSFRSIRRLCTMLSGLRQLLADYRVAEYMVYATAVMREAENRRAILDLIKVHTGFQVEVVDMPQEIYYKHFALHYEAEHLLRKMERPVGENFLFVDITSGCVGLTVWEKGELKFQHNVHIGTLRLLETFRLNQRDSLDFPEAMREYIHAVMLPLWDEIRQYHPSCLVLSGREARIMGELMHVDMSQNAALVQPAAFHHFYEAVGNMSVQRLMSRYHLSDQWARSVLPTAHLYREILKNVPVNSLLMMGTSFLEAASLFYGAKRTKDPAIIEMRSHNLELARSMAAGYFYEPKHARAMEEYSRVILDALDEVNGLDERDAFLLRMAIILYETGKYVNLLEHNVHTWHIIRGIDVFGLSDKEKDTVACIAYYDHKGMPGEDDEPFRIVPEKAKMNVLKLIAVFRLARAMDMGRQQKLKHVSAHLKDNALVIQYDSRENTALESWVFEKEADIFQNVFGLEARLERR